VNDTFATLGLLEWKPLAAALLLPPVPWLVLLLMGWWWRRYRPVVARLCMVLALSGLWLCQTQGLGRLIERELSVAPALSPSRVAEIRRNLPVGKVAVVILGSGANLLAPEYGEAHLAPTSMERLHYGLWLSRQLQLPVLFSGGAGHAQPDGPREAQVAARIAARDYGRTLRWLEGESHDTRDNARRSVQMLKDDGITQVVLVTHGWHMRRSQRAFEQEAVRQGVNLQIQPAPMGMPARSEAVTALHWLPSPDGYRRVHQALREYIGLLAGA
jgi:uncharacterized SAM-binding protein YcdF (DUF218 family)